MTKKTSLFYDSLKEDLNITAKKEEQKIIVFSLADRVQKPININIRFEASNSSIELYGLIILKDRDILQLNTKQHHKSKKNTSKVLIKSILFDSSHLDYLAQIHIGKKAFQTDASMEMRSLIMSTNAKVKNIPSLEILNRQVFCSHKSAIHSLDKNELMYLVSRGFNLFDASKLLIEGFMNDIVGKIQDKKQRKNYKQKMISVVDKFIKSKKGSKDA